MADRVRSGVGQKSIPTRRWHPRLVGRAPGAPSSGAIGRDRRAVGSGGRRRSGWLGLVPAANARWVANAAGVQVGGTVRRDLCGAAGPRPTSRSGGMGRGSPRPVGATRAIVRDGPTQPQTSTLARTRLPCERRVLRYHYRPRSRADSRMRPGRSRAPLAPGSNRPGDLVGDSAPVPDMHGRFPRRDARPRTRRPVPLHSRSGGGTAALQHRRMGQVPVDFRGKCHARYDDHDALAAQLPRSRHPHARSSRPHPPVHRPESRQGVG